MIQFDQTLQLRRLVVMKSYGALYDEVYHSGVNIIRGENSTGKSTIADFIFFALGGDLTALTPQAALAESVHAEVLLNRITYTISRDVDSSARSPMYFFAGTFDEAMSRRESWLKYPFSRSASTESFSQMMFRLLRLPEQKTEAQQNITMHQILRLLYCDQMTSVDQIFRKEKFDTRDTRIAISELLLGSDDLAMHGLRMEIRDSDRKYGEAVGELRSIFRILGKTSDSNVGVVDFESEMRQLEEERKSISISVQELSTRKEKLVRKEATSRADELSRLLRVANDQIEVLLDSQHVLSLDIEDSELFIRTLEERIRALDVSNGMMEILGAVNFTYCPACLTPVNEHQKAGVCNLCKTELLDTALSNTRMKMREELQFQTKESLTLLGKKKSKLIETQKQLNELKAEQKRLNADLNEFKIRLDPIDAEISNQFKRIGYLDRSIEDLTRKAELAALVIAKMRARDELADNLNKLRTKLEAFELARSMRRDNLQYQISELCVDALHHDLPLEEVFTNAEVVQFDFGQNKIAVDGRNKFSASSATYLKNAFLFSLFELSLRDREARWPRFILLDNIEDKGMQPNRSANFQEYVSDRSKSYDVDHQIIMTTSMISPKLENSVMCVGPHYTSDNKTLKFVSTKPTGMG